MAPFWDTDQKPIILTTLKDARANMLLQRNLRSITETADINLKAEVNRAAPKESSRPNLCQLP